MKRPALISGACLATLMVYMSVVIHHQLKVPYKPWRCTLPYANCVEASVHGNVDPAYDEVRRIFQQNLDSGEDVGAGVAVFVRNQLVVDLKGGWQQLSPRVPYSDNTLQLVYSSTKMLVSALPNLFFYYNLSLVTWKKKSAEAFVPRDKNDAEAVKARNLACFPGIAARREAMQRKK